MHHVLCSMFRPCTIVPILLIQNVKVKIESRTVKLPTGEPYSDSVLPGFHEWTRLQVLIIWWSRVWICGMERHGLIQPTLFTRARKSNVETMAVIFKQNFPCDTYSEFLFSKDRRPKFNINSYLDRDERSFL